MSGEIETPKQFGIGDGSTINFELSPLAGESIAQVIIANLFRNDWQGNQLLYATPRTNYISSSTYKPATWVDPASSGITFTAGIDAPDGSQSAVRCDLTTASGPNRLVRVIANTTIPSGTFVGSFWCRLVSGTPGAISTDISDFVISEETFYTPALGVWTHVTGVPLITSGLSPVFDLINNTALGYVIDFWGVQIEGGNVSGSYIPTTTSPVTVTDYALDNTGNVTLAVPAPQDAVLTWTGAYIYTPVPIPPNFPLNTIISEFANSPTLVQLIKNFKQYIDPSVNIDAFYDYVWNIDTAVGYGLDIWGKIVGLDNGRLLKIPSSEIDLGFHEAGTASATPFGSGVFYSGMPVSQNFFLADGAFRTLILVKALANISDGSAASINRLLQNLFAGRGRAYVNDLGNMQMRYTFEFFLQPYEIAIMTQSGVMPRTTGVLATLVQIPQGSTFGFQEAGAQVAPFGQGTFFTGGLNAL